ncbi:MAG: hypothetical protein WBV46_01500 [Terriglobales bacterium]|jgi:hypothetical protein
MRPYFALCAVVLIAVAAFAQEPHHRDRRRFSGEGYEYGYTYAPLITTPMLSFETVSPNPIGASNATTGLIAGATNATASEMPEGFTSSDYTVAVWYQGGSPVIEPEVSTWPVPREGEAGMMHGPRGYEAGEERGEMHREERHEKRAEWIYFSGAEHTTDVASAAKGPGPGKHSYTNGDVTRQNDQNGNVKYDSKTEKIQ